MAGMLLPPIAVIAGYLTFRQLRESKNSRVAAHYLQINERYNSALLRKARRTIKAMVDAYPTAETSTEELGDYVCRLLSVWQTQDLTSSEYAKYNDCMRIMEFWEEVGVLVRRDLIDPDVLFDYQAGAVLYAEQVFLVFLTQRRRDLGSRKYYANALWLMSQAHLAHPSEFLPAPRAGLQSGREASTRKRRVLFECGVKRLRWLVHDGSLNKQVATGQAR